MKLLTSSIKNFVSFLYQFMSKMSAFPEKLFCVIYFYENSFTNYCERHFKTFLPFSLKKHRMIDLHVIQTEQGRS